MGAPQQTLWLLNLLGVSLRRGSSPHCTPTMEDPGEQMSEWDPKAPPPEQGILGAALIASSTVGLRLPHQGNTVCTCPLLREPHHQPGSSPEGVVQKPAGLGWRLAEEVPSLWAPWGTSPLPPSWVGVWRREELTGDSQRGLGFCPVSLV